jgi:hypothetical protein
VDSGDGLESDVKSCRTGLSFAKEQVGQLAVMGLVPEGLALWLGLKVWKCSWRKPISLATVMRVNKRFSSSKLGVDNVQRGSGVAETPTGGFAQLCKTHVVFNKAVTFPHVIMLCECTL